MKFKYCIECGKMDIAFKTFTGEAHWKPMFHICRGPFATTRPPETPADWIDHVVEPAPFELAIMNQNALALQADLKM